MAYGSEIERIASQAASASSARSLETAMLLKKVMRANSMASPIRGAASTSRNKGTLRSPTPVGPSKNFAGPFIKEVHDPLKNFSVTSGFGWRINPVSGERSKHTGIDLAAPEGTPIYASANGRVRRAHWEDIDGNMIVLGHGGKRKTSYSHLSRIVVRRGQRIRRGQLIGYVGSTGWSTGPHLHWQVYKRGNPINPRKFLRGR